MAITAKLREDGSGGSVSPWATDRDAVAVTVDNEGQTGVATVQILNSEIELTSSVTTNGGAQGKGAASAFTDGVIRATLATSLAAASDANSVGLGLRVGAGAIGARIRFGPNGTTNSILRLEDGTTFRDSVTIAWAPDTPYEVLLAVVGAGVSAKVMAYQKGLFPPGSDYKTPTWNMASTYTLPTASGVAAVYFRRDQTSAPTGKVDELLAFDTAAGSVTVGTVGLTGGSGQLTVAWTDATALQKRGTLWYFLRYKAASQPTDENDGTLIAGAGTGLGGSAVRSDGRFLDDPADFALTGLTNGTTYFVRPFAVQADGTIVAGTAVSATPAGGDTTPPSAPTDLAAAFASPHVAARVDLSWTNPSEAGNYRITYRTDGTDPVSSTDASATLLLDWTAYTSNSAGTYSATGLTNGLRYRFAVWHRDAALNVNGGATVQKVACTKLVLATPSAGVTGITQAQIVLVWHTAATESETALPTHYHVQVDDDPAFGSPLVDVSSLTGIAGFQYEATAGNWQPLPTAGLASADQGKDVRYFPSVNAPAHYYWRVRPEQPGV